jgi:hypothetical protein
MSVASSVAVTFDTPLFTGGPAAVVWAWALGAVMDIFLALGIAGKIYITLESVIKRELISDAAF